MADLRLYHAEVLELLLIRIGQLQDRARMLRLIGNMLQGPGNYGPEAREVLSSIIRMLDADSIKDD